MTSYSKLNGISAFTKVNGITTWSKINGLVKPSSLLVGITSYYKLDESSGTVATDSTGNSDGTNYSATVNQTGKIGTSYSFNGTGSYIYTNQTNQSDYVSICAWIYPTSVTSRSIVSADQDGTGQPRNWQFTIESGILNFIFIDLPTGVYFATSTTTLAINNWYFVCAVTNGTDIKLYVNNNLEDTEPAPAVMQHNAKIDIGVTRQNANPIGKFFSGKIDEVGIWSRALTSTEVTQLYNSGSGKTYPFL